MSDKTALTEAENKILALAWQCFKNGQPEINWDKLSKLAGHTNPGSTRNSFAKIKLKLQKIAGPIDNDNDDDATGPSATASRFSHIPSAGRPKRATAATKRKASAGVDNDNDETDAEPGAPSAKGKGNGKAKKPVAKKAKSEQADADATESDGAAGKQKAGSKKGAVKKPAVKGLLFPNLPRKGTRSETPRTGSAAAAVSESEHDAGKGPIKEEEEGEEGLAV